jgi:cell division septation protein DedD
MRYVSFVMIAALFSLGCAQLDKLRSRDKSETTEPVVEDTTVNLPYDPLSLGPDVFALAAAEESAESNSNAQTTSGFRVQIGAFVDEKRAQDLAIAAERSLQVKSYVVFDRPFYRVRIGNCDTMKQAEELKSAATAKGFPDARITSDRIEPAPKQ